jgi:transcriptional regulator PpsR
MRAFRTPKSTLGDLDADAVAELIAAATDIALIVDEAGVIQDVAIAADDLARDLPGHERWVGKLWADTFSSDSHPKAESLIADALSRKEPRWRHLNHPGSAGVDVPILYAAIQAGIPGRIVAFGRNLRAVSSLQRRLVDAQQSMERDYARVRRMETRYRLLFEMASDAVLIVDAASQRVTDSNSAAGRMFGAPAGRGGTWRVAHVFSAETAPSVELLLAGLVASGRADDVRARLAADDREVLVSASLFRDDGGVFCLVRIASVQADLAGAIISKARSKLLKLMDGSPDGFVVTGADGRVITANTAFLQLVQLPNESQVRGESLDRWLGRAGVDLEILTANLRQHGSVRLFATTIRGELGESSDIEISATTVMNGGQPCFGLAIRDVARRLPRNSRGDEGGDPARQRRLPPSLEHLSELIGRVALKDLVREATDVIERLCIEAALELTRDNRASAAEILGLSRQSLYVKLRRYGLGPLSPEGAD